MNHKHEWHLHKTFISAGKPRIMNRYVVGDIMIPSPDVKEPQIVETWLDSRQEYARFICLCGVQKTVAVRI